MDWSSLIEFNVSPVELVVRGSLLYWFLFLVFRFVLRRDAGGLGVADVLLVVLVADASQNAMTGGYTSVAEGLVLVSTLIGWNWLLDWAAFRWRAVRRFVEPRALPLIHNGRVVHRNLRAEFLTLEALHGHLRQNGVTSPAQVRRACMESDGQISVLKYPDGNDADAGKAKKAPGGAGK